MSGIFQNRRTIQRCVAVLFVFTIFGAVVIACDTPVYRYAMYRWQSTPYEVYYFHSDPLDDEAKEIAQRLTELAENLQMPTNVIHTAVNITDDSELRTVPPDVKDMWLKREDTTVPQYLISTPQGAKIFTGKLTVDDVEKLIDSPVRREIAKRLEAGHASVMVLLGGVKESAGEGEETKLVDDTEATVAAQKEVEKLIEDITAGKVNLYATPNETGFPEKPAEEPESEEETEATEQPEHEVSFVKVSRTDPKEAWLVRSLMSIEDDLYEFNEPMVFAVYGRARALPPYIGKGITRDNLIDCVDFVTGACSCTVKEQNPGMDLLVRYDWETAAEKVAERFGAEEGNEFKFSSEDFFPQLLIPPADEPETTEVSVNETDSSNEPDGATDTQPKETDDNNDDEVVAEKNPIADENETDVAHANLPTQATNPQEMIVETSKSGTFIVGIGLVFALLTLFGATFLVLRPR